MFKSLFILVFLSLVSCTSTSKLSNEAVFNAENDEVWESIVSVFKSYPIKTIDINKGILETKTLIGKRFWLAPHQKSKDINGLSASIKVSLFDEKPLPRVVIEKTIHKRSSFISDSKKIPSDLLEEASLLYRIKREIEVRKGFKRINN